MYKTYANYEIEAFGECEAGPCIIQAPSKGCAVEHFLVIHGMLWYDDLKYIETNKEPDETIDDFIELCGKLSKEKIKELDDYHIPNINKFKVKLNFTYNSPTENKRIYPKKLFIKAMNQAVKKKIPVLVDNKNLDAIFDITTHAGYLDEYDGKEDKISIALHDNKIGRSLIDLIQCGTKWTTSGYGKINKDFLVEEIEFNSIFPIVEDEEKIK